MRSILDALQEGRLIELPDNDKNTALEYLATLIEAIPDIGVEGGIIENVFAREQAHSTAIGMGWACPHARSTKDGQLLCAMGWSPKGIDYGSPDGKPVHIIVMYFVPDTQKNAYLKEISTLAKAIQSQPDLQSLQSLEDLNETRHRLLDAVSVALESTSPEARARMIQLEVKQSTVKEDLPPTPAVDLSGFVIPFSVVVVAGVKPLVLCQDKHVVAQLEGREALASELATGRLEHQGMRVVVHSISHFQPDRLYYDCLAIKNSS